MIESWQAFTDPIAIRLFGTVGIVIITKHIAHLIYLFKVGVGPE